MKRFTVLISKVTDRLSVTLQKLVWSHFSKCFYPHQAEPMCFRRALAHRSYEHKHSLLAKQTPISLSPYVKADFTCTIHSPGTNILLARVRDTPRDHLCNSSSGVLRAQILHLNCLSFPSVSVWKQGRNAGHNTEFAVWGKWKVLEKWDYWLWEIRQITQQKEARRKQSQLTRNKKNG